MKILLVFSLFYSLTFAGLFGNTDKKRKIAQKKLTSLILSGQNKEITQLQKENKHVSYEIIKIPIVD